ncbi:MAG: hypothetical protein ACE5JG_09680, partial [Planctomycetota bacterium]
DVDSLATPAGDLRLQSGRATEGIVTSTISLAPLKVKELYARCELRGLGGPLGGRRGAAEGEDLPRLQDGRAILLLRDGVLNLHQVRASFRSPRGERGTIEGEGRIPVAAGRGDTELRFSGRDITVTTRDLGLLLTEGAAPKILDRYNPAGTADFELKLSQAPGEEPALKATLEVRDGKARYDGRVVDPATGGRDGFPYPLERCTGTLEIDTGVRTDRGRARRVTFTRFRGYHPIRNPDPGGPRDARFVIDGQILSYLELPAGPEDIDLRIEARNIPIDEDLEQAFAANVHGVPYADFDASGEVKEVQIHVQAHADQDDTAYSHYDILLSDCRIAYRPFPLHARDLSGFVRVRTLPPSPDGKRLERITVERLEGTLRDGGTVAAGGTIGERPDGGSAIDLTIGFKDVVLGPDMRRALEGEGDTRAVAARMWDDLRPSGRIDAEVHLRDLSRPEVVVHLGGRVRLGGYREARCPLEGLSGRLALRQGVYHFEEVSGRLGEASVTLQGHADPGGATRVEAEAAGWFSTTGCGRSSASCSPRSPPCSPCWSPTSTRASTSCSRRSGPPPTRRSSSSWRRTTSCSPSGSATTACCCGAAAYGSSATASSSRTCGSARTRRGSGSRRASSTPPSPAAAASGSRRATSSRAGTCPSSSAAGRRRCSARTSAWTCTSWR